MPPVDAAQEFLNQLKNQPCLQAWRGYHDAIFFELGEQLQESSSSEQLARGTYTLAFMNCLWEIHQDNKVIADNTTPWREMDEKITLFEGQKCLEIRLYPEKNMEDVLFTGGLKICTHRPDSKHNWHIVSSHAVLVFQGDHPFFEEHQSNERKEQTPSAEKSV